ATALAYTMPVVAGVILPLGAALLTWRVWGDDSDAVGSAEPIGASREPREGTRNQTARRADPGRAGSTAALVAAAFVAVTAPQVIFSSHGMPATLGASLLFVLLVFFLESVRPTGEIDPRYAALLLPVGVALVLSHHLSTYFAVGIVAGAAFLRELGSTRSNTARLRVELPLVGGLVALAAWWWLVVATPMRDQIVGEALALPPVVTALVFVAALAALPLVVLVKRRVPALRRIRFHPRLHGSRRALALYAGFVLVFLAGSLYFVFVDVPGTDLSVPPITLAYLAPVVLLLALALVGASAAKLARDGWFAWGWMAAILLSLVFAAVTKNHVIFPFRHIDVLVDGLSMLIGIGFVACLALVGARSRRARLALVTALVLVLFANAATANPPREAIAGFEEGVTHDEYTAILWARDHLPADSTIAADHRVSSLLFGVAHLAASWDYTNATYHATSWPPVAAELAALDIPGHPHARIDYVFLSPEIRKGVILVQWENALPMSDAAYAKFFTDTTHFTKVCGDGLGDCTNGVYIFRVNWNA
ncbi:MAG: hypothetical protein ACYDCK_15475, partial [Thermoplasmatota archaeon]